MADRTGGRRSPSRDASRSSGRRLLIAFAVFGSCVAVYYAITALPWFTDAAFPAYLRLNAAISSWILTLFGEAATVDGTQVLSPRYALEVRRGCDAIEPAALYAAAVAAFPVGVRRSLVGLLVGVPTLLALNIVRIVSLFYVGVFAPTSFDTVHVDVWQPLFILVAIVLWLAWALWATRRRKDPTDSGDATP